MRIPAIAGPMSWPALKTVVNKATALVISFLSTRFGTEDVRARKPIEKVMPPIKERTKICQTCTTSVITSTDKASNVDILKSSEKMIIFFLLNLSAKNPPISDVKS